MRRRACGLEAARAAVETGEAGLLLRVDDGGDDALDTLEAQAVARNVVVWRGSEGDMRRMSPDSANPHRAIAMLGERPDVDVETAIARPGAHWLLHRAAYPSNVGFAIRTVEVGGAASIAIDAAFNHGDRSRVSHVSMGADRLLPVNYADTGTVMSMARRKGHRVVAIEAQGETAPWEVDLSGSILLVVGAEREGIAADVLQACDAVIRIPMEGFVPSYSVQAAVSAVAAERLRQLSALR